MTQLTLGSLGCSVRLGLGDDAPSGFVDRLLKFCSRRSVAVTVAHRRLMPKAPQPTVVAAEPVPELIAQGATETEIADAVSVQGT